jgi:hypothetical protein
LPCAGGIRERGRDVWFLVDKSVWALFFPLHTDDLTGKLYHIGFFEKYLWHDSQEMISPRILLFSIAKSLTREIWL